MQKKSREFPPTFSYRLFHGITHLFRMFMPCDCISFSKTPKISKKKFARVPPYIFIFAFSQASDIRCRHALRHSISFLALYSNFCIIPDTSNFALLEPLFEKNGESPPLHFQISFFTGLRHPFSACSMPFYIIFYALKQLFYHFKHFPIDFGDFQNFQKIS